MDESRNNLTGRSGEAMVVLFFVFAMLIFLLYKFGSNSNSVVNSEVFQNQNQESNLTREEIFEQIKAENDSEVFAKYLEKIKSLKDNASDGEIDGVQDLTGNIGEEYKKELENKVLLPQQIVKIKGEILENTYANRANYLNNFEKLFADFKSGGGFSESKIFAAQITPTPALPQGEGGVRILELSGYDRETLLRLATEYELWSEQILNLNVPKVYENKSLEAAKSTLNISYILKKMVDETDEKVYPMWIGQYTRVIFDIIANRYAK